MQGPGPGSAGFIPGPWMAGRGMLAVSAVGSVSSLISGLEFAGWKNPGLSMYLPLHLNLRRGLQMVFRYTKC